MVLWWAHLGSNQGPTGYEPVALPTELWALQAQAAFSGIFPPFRSGALVLRQPTIIE